MTRRHPNVVNLDEIEPAEGPRKGKFGSRMRPVARAAGAKEIGCTFYEVAPGETAFPRHWHAANEEALVVIEGEGRLRIGDAEVAVRAGDYVALPVGPAGAHQLWNSGAGALRYYALSTMRNVELVGYPDSKKLGAGARLAEGPVVRQLFYEEDARGYFDREEAAGD